MTDTPTDELDEKAARMFVLRLALAQLDNNVDALEDVVHEIIDAGREYVWYTAEYLSSVMSEAIVQHCHGDRVAAAQKAAHLSDDMAPSVTAANRLIRAWFEDQPDAVANVLADLELGTVVVALIVSRHPYTLEGIGRTYDLAGVVRKRPQCRCRTASLSRTSQDGTPASAVRSGGNH